jgi:hypothetical protein
LPEGDSSVGSQSPAAHSLAPDSPAWIRDAAERAWEELRLYVETAVLFTLRPGRFALEWVEGRRLALNPLAMLATAAGVLGTATNLLGRLLGRSGGESTLLRDVIAAVAPFVHYAVLGALCHAVLRLFGSRRPLRDSLGLALFAGGGPAVGTVLLTYLVGAGLWLANGRPTIVAGLMGSLPHRSAIALSVLAVGGFIAFFISFLLAMAAVHRVRRWKTLLALLAAVAIAAMIFGALDSQAGFGPHLFWVRKPLRLDLWLD